MNKPILVILKIASRTTFKLAGIVLLIVGLSVVIYAASFLESSTYYIEAWDSDQPISSRGETPFQRYLIGLFGVLTIFLGYKALRFIPYDERDTKNVTEFDLDPENN
jgi:hypothetical protein|tara:strand:- start:1344 stop:1664 length:321 start_codon:yes stop_codon:yes gene_type:complete